MAKDSIKIHIGAKDAASSVIQGVSARAVALGVTLGNLASKAIVGVINGMRGWVNEALEAEQANVALDAALRGSGQYTAELSKQYRDLANAIQDETGASDESVKANIAQLASLGVTADRMGMATRAVSALSAMGREGNSAMNAVARALNGDIAAFDKFSPAVRNATTVAEKYAAAQQYIEAGYAQQKASLNTVGGAWQALKERIGDAREDIIGAIFEGLKLGTTFNSMQDAAGKFLKSESFTRITESLKNGAAYALEIAKAMTADGGAKEVASAIGSVILAALQDGADYVGEKIKGAFGSKSGINPVDFAKSEMVRGEAEKKAFKESSFWDKMGFEGTRKSMAAGEAAVQEWFKKNFDAKRGGRLDEALAKLKTAVQKNAEKVDRKAAIEDGGAKQRSADLAEQKEKDDLAKALADAAAKAQKKIADKEREKSELAERKLNAEKVVAEYTEAEAEAKKKATSNQQRLNALAAKNLAEYIADAQNKRSEEKERTKADNAAKKKLAKLEAAEAKGIGLSRKDREFLQDARDQERLRKAANDAMIRARREEIEARRLKEIYDAELKRLNERQTKALESIDSKIEDALEAGN